MKQITMVEASVKLFSALLLCLLVAFVGGWFSEGSIHWFNYIDKPSWSPPGWIFPLIWTPLYLMMGLSLWFIMMKQDEPKPTFWPYFWFFVQLALNLAWSPSFFFLECSICGTIVMAFLIAAILITMVSFYRYLPVAAYLLIPYFIWVVFAGILNFAIFRMNP
jgi:benzodiazapine receptor